MFPEMTEFKSTFRLTEKNYLVEYNGDIELIFIELPKFNKSEDCLNDITDKWIYFIKNAGSLAYIPETLSVLPELSHAFTIANEAGLTLEEQEAQWKRKDFIMLQKGSIELAEKKGIEKGKTEVAWRLIAKGMAIEEAAEVAGVDVEALRNGLVIR